MKKKKASILIVFVLVLLCFSLFFTQNNVVFAGSTLINVADSTSFKDGINTGVWYNVGNVKAENDAIVFDESVDVNAQIISKTKANNLSQFGLEDVIYGSVSLTVKELADRFCIVIGLRLPNEQINSANSVSMYFCDKDGALAFGMSRYDTNGDEVKLIEATTFDNVVYSSVVAVEFRFKTEGRVSVKINGNELLCTDTAINSVGYFGFGQTALSEVVISDSNVKSLKYDRPENPTVAKETFNNSEFNANIWYITAIEGYYKPSAVTIREDRLLYENASEGYFGTLYSYSNFNLTLDIPYIQREDIKNPTTGDMVKTASNWIGICFGAPKAKNTISANLGSATSPLIYLKSGSNNTYLNFLYKGQETSDKLDSKYNIFDENTVNGRTISIKLTSENRSVKLYIKYSDETEFGLPVFEREIEGTPLGYVQIWTTGPAMVGKYPNGLPKAGNFAIDNVEIVNTDVSPVLTEVEFKTNKRPERGEDYAYIDTWDYNDSGVSAVTGSAGGCGAQIFGGTTPNGSVSGGFGGGLAFELILIAVILIVAGTFVVLRRK